MSARDDLPPAQGDEVDVFGSDIEEQEQERDAARRRSSVTHDDDDEDLILPQKSAPTAAQALVAESTLASDPVPVSAPASARLESSRPRDDDDALSAPSRIPRRSNVMDNLDDDDYEDEDEEFSGKKRRKPQGSSSKKSRRVDSDDDDVPRRTREDDYFIDDRGAKRDASDEDDVIRTEGGLSVSREIEDDNPEEEPEKPKRKLNVFEEAVERTKSYRRTRRKEVDPSKIEGECLAFLDRMMQARDEDVRCYKKGRPALNKLKMLREVETMTTKVTHRDVLIDNMLLPIIKAWLDPMPDGTLPNVQIRTSLLKILSSIRVDDTWVDRLKNSQGLGRVVHFLARNDDHMPNRRAADKLMMKWARPVYQSNSNFQDLLSEYDRPEEGYRASDGSIAAERRKQMESGRQYRTSRERSERRRSKAEPEREQIMAQIPQPAAFNYTALAASRAQVDEKVMKEHRSQASTTRKVNRTMSRLRSLNKNRSARAAKPSLNGRD